MRRLFAITMIVSLLAALVVGAAYAWTAGGSWAGNVNTGQVSISIENVTADPISIYPLGTRQEVANGTWTNTTNNDPGIPLRLTGMAVTIQSPNSGSSPSVTECELTSDYAYDTGSQDPGVGGLTWQAYVIMGTGAAQSCQGVNITYDISFTASTT